MARLAISHDWLLTPRGAERVLCEFCRVHPDAAIYTLFWNRQSAPGCVAPHRVQPSPLNQLPGVHRYYRYLLPLYRAGIERLRVRDADVLLSISHSIAKAIPRADGMPHVCYCLTPARYIWQPELYGRALDGPVRHRLTRGFVRRWKAWDLDTNTRVDHFVAISDTVRSRIRMHYGRDAEVIYPCVDLDFFRPDDRARNDFYLVVSALVPQKRLALAVEAFNRNRRPLWIVGDGPLRRPLSRLARSNVRFLGWQPDERIRELYRRARALVFPGTEDFGLVPVEAQACGCPVIAHASGGVVETTVEGTTAVYFRDLTTDALGDAVATFERSSFDASSITRHVGRFSRETFDEQWRMFWARLGLM